MALTVNSSSTSNGQPSAPFQVIEVNVDLDNSYPTGGYSIANQLDGLTVVASQLRPDFDSSTLRHIKISAAGSIQVFDNDSGGQGSETSNATDVSGHTGVVLWAMVE